METNSSFKRLHFVGQTPISRLASFSWSTGYSLSRVQKAVQRLTSRPAKGTGRLVGFCQPFSSAQLVGSRLDIAVSRLLLLYFAMCHILFFRSFVKQHKQLCNVPIQSAGSFSHFCYGICNSTNRLEEGLLTYISHTKSFMHTHKP